MLGTITAIKNNQVIVKLSIDIHSQVNLINLHVVFEDEESKVVGEIVSIEGDIMRANIVGELKDDIFVPGVSVRPSFKAKIRVVVMDELEKILGSTKVDVNQVNFGVSNVYKNYAINVNVDSFFSNHFAIIGNTGAGKSFTLTRLLQNLFTSSEYLPVGANIFLFDAFGEYTKAFQSIHSIAPVLNYKTYTTNTKYPDTDILQIPLWLLDVDDIAILLGATNQLQLPIIEKALKLVTVLRSDGEDVVKHKNDIIARAVLDILLSSDDASKIRDQITAILTNFHTTALNLDTEIVQPGYTRPLKQCLYVDKTGKLQEMELVVNFMQQFIEPDLELKNPDGTIYYTLDDLEQALDFALISEGIYQSNQVYDYANILKIRLHSLNSSNAKQYFSYPKMVYRNDYINGLLKSKEGGKCQIVNFNINYVDDRMAKAITKILSRMLFTAASENINRASFPFHIFIEEAHRYVQRDMDTELLGYNIFERISKEGRKYGVLLGLITQRPSELSDTVISQCSNFLILRVLHPKDLEYIKNMVPNISQEIVENLKTLQPGNCIAFGSAFKVPISMYFKKPNPEPLSNNARISSIWYRTTSTEDTVI